jgi:hypothetical protein
VPGRNYAKGILLVLKYNGCLVTNFHFINAKPYFCRLVKKTFRLLYGKLRNLFNPRFRRGGLAGNGHKIGVGEKAGDRRC